jgi:hypothetical protein
MAAGLRAQLLSQTAQRMAEGGASAEARSEVEDLQRISEEVSALYRQMLDDIRARGADVTKFDRG